MVSLTRRRLACGTTCPGSPSTAYCKVWFRLQEGDSHARCPKPMEGDTLRRRSGALSAAEARSCRTATARDSSTASPMVTAGPRTSITDPPRDRQNTVHVIRRRELICVHHLRSQNAFNCKTTNDKTIITPTSERCHTEVHPRPRPKPHLLHL